MNRILHISQCLRMLIRVYDFYISLEQRFKGKFTYDNFV